ncbi:MAG: hypothetical protein ACOCRK_11895, partial [bacterium]
YFISILIYLLILIIDIRLDIIPYFPDTDLYTNILRGNVEIAKTHSLGVRIGFKYLSTLFNYISAKIPLLYILFNMMLNQVGLMICWKAWMIYKEGDISIQEQRNYLIMAFVYPVSIIFSLVPLRESYMLFAFALFLLGVVQKKRVNIFLLLGTLLIFILRNELIIFSVMVLIAKYLFIYHKIIKKTKLLFFIILIPIIYGIINYVSTNYLNISITPSSLASFRNFQRNSYLLSGAVYPEVFWKSWFDVIKDFPFLILQFLFAPFPIIVNMDFSNKITYLLDGIYVSFLISYLLLNIKKVFSNKLWLSIFIMFVSLNSMYEYYMTASIRHRYYGIILLIPMFSELITKRECFDQKRSDLNGNRTN